MASGHINGSELRGKRFLKVFGNTYAHRDKIRGLGDAYFSSEEKCWVVRLGALAQNQKAQIASKTYELSKLGLRFEAEE